MSPNESSESGLRLEDITVKFSPATSDEKMALEKVSLHLPAGEFCVVIGTNGAGKSTLLNVVSGAIRPQQGKILLNDQDITPISVHRRARFIARVFQDPMRGTAPGFTVEENLSWAAMRNRRRGIGRAFTPARREWFRDLLSSFGLGLENRLSASAGQLSGGQRQVLALVMATMLKPSLLLLDEHTAALDPKTADRVMDATTKLVAHSSLTTMMVTHKMSDALACGNRLLMMESGRIKIDLGKEEKRHMSIAELISRFDTDADHLILQAGSAQ